MRRAGFALASFLAVVPAVAQDRPYQPVPPAPIPGAPQPPAVAPLPGGRPLPAGQPQPAAVDPVALQHLNGWEKAMGGVKTFAVEAVMTKKDRGTDRSEKFAGKIWCMAPNLTRLNLEKQLPPTAKANGEEFTAFISDGKVVYHYDGAAKTVTVAKLGPNGAGNNLLLDVMSGMTAANALARFEVTSLQPKDPKDVYLYLELKPRFKEDKGEFEVMQLILIPPTVGGGRAYLPRKVTVTKPGGQLVEEWDFPDPKVNPPGTPENPKGIVADHFQWVEPPKGWKVQRADPPPAPAGPQPKGLVAPPPVPKK